MRTKAPVPPPKPRAPLGAHHHIKAGVCSTCGHGELWISLAGTEACSNCSPPHDKSVVASGVYTRPKKKSI